MVEVFDSNYENEQCEWIMSWTGEDRETGDVSTGSKCTSCFLLDSVEDTFPVTSLLAGVTMVTPASKMKEAFSLLFPHVPDASVCDLKGTI